MMMGGGKTEISADEVIDSEECRLGPAEAFWEENKANWCPWQLHPDLQGQQVLRDNCLYFISSLNGLIWAPHSSFHTVIHLFSRGLHGDGAGDTVESQTST